MLLNSFKYLQIREIALTRKCKPFTIGKWGVGVSQINELCAMI